MRARARYCSSYGEIIVLNVKVYGNNDLELRKLDELGPDRGVDQPIAVIGDGVLSHRLCLQGDW